MKTVGKFTTLALVAGGIGVAVITVQSIPDIKRYLKIRQM